jgi:hypothetical protein
MLTTGRQDKTTQHSGKLLQINQIIMEKEARDVVFAVAAETSPFCVLCTVLSQRITDL